MERIVKLWCVLCGFISSATMATQTECTTSSDVRDLRPSSVNSSSITLRWEAPAYVCGGLVGYELLAWQTKNISGSNRLGTYIPKPGQSATFDKLEPNAEYSFTVCALSTSPRGAPIEGTLAKVEVTTVPGPVTGLTVQQQNAGSLKFSWKAPKNSAIFEICVYAIRPDGNQCRFTSGEEDTRRGLAPNTVYNIRATAVRLDERNQTAARGTSASTTAETIGESVTQQFDAHDDFRNSSTEGHDFTGRAQQRTTPHYDAHDDFRNSSTKSDNFPKPNSWSIWISENGQLLWAIAATVAAAASISVNVMFCVCSHRLRYMRWRNGRLYKTKVCSRCSQMASTVKSVATTDAPTEIMDPLVELPDSSAAEIEAPYTSLEHSQRISRIYESLSHSNLE